MVDGECELCGEVHVHEYTEYEYYSNTQHIEKCACGAVGTYLSAHTVRSGIGRFKTCIFCGGLVESGNILEIAPLKFHIDCRIHEHPFRKIVKCK